MDWYWSRAYPVAKTLHTLLRHGELPREEDVAIEFWRMKDDLRNKFEYSQYWSDEMWKSRMAKGGGNKKIFQHCTDPSGQEILDLRALQGHSGRNPIDPTLQDNVISGPFLRVHWSYWMCNQFTFHISSGLILGEQNLSNRQTVFFLPVDPMDNHKDPDTIDLGAPRLAQYMPWSMEETSKHGLLGRPQLCFEERSEVLSDSIERIILQETLPAYCIPKVVRMETVEFLNEKVYMSPRPPPKISLKHDWVKELSSRSCSTTTSGTSCSTV